LFCSRRSIEPSVFRKLSVADNIMAVLELNQALDKAAQKNRLEELLAEFNIGHIRALNGLSLSFYGYLK
jgi:lipopolysaccharide export system ATP-binding protein